MQKVQQHCESVMVLELTDIVAFWRMTVSHDIPA